jgi:uncharacterized membrane protein YheB (UPF0754 family)
MMIPRAVVAPVVGGVIGYITNDLAIRMLFRPRKALYIGRFHVPFTPGLIPSQQGRIAQSIGGVVSGQLLNEETLRQTLLSGSTLDTLRRKVTVFLRTLSKDERTVCDLLRIPGIREKVDVNADALSQKLTDALTAKIIDARLGGAVVDSVIGDRMDFITQNALFSRLIDGSAQERIRDKLAEKVDDLIAEKAPDAAAAIVSHYRGEIMDARLCDLYARVQGREQKIIDSVVDLYANLLGNNLGRLLEAINIEQIVVDKINGLDAAQLETTIFGIMKRELKAIVYLGALLGFLMGFINLLL